MNNNNNSNFNQAVWLGIGSLSSFLLSFVSAAILSRYFDKTEYGTYKQILYVYTTLYSLFTMGLPSVFSYFIPRLESGQQKTLITGLNRVFIIIGAFFSVSLFFLSGPISILLKNPELSVGLKIFSPFPLFTLPAMGVGGIYTALRKTRTLALYDVSTKALMVVFIVVPVIVFHGTYKHAVIGWGIASFITFLWAMYLKNRPYTEVKKELFPNMYKAVFSYSIPLMGAFIGGFFISSADQFFVSRYFGTAVFAEVSNGCMTIPIATMVAGSVKSVLTPLFSKAESKGMFSSILGTYENAVKKTVTLVFPMLLFCIFFAREIMLIVYGSQYGESGKYMRVFLWREFFNCLPYFSVLMALGASKIYMNMHLIGAVLLWSFDLLVVTLGLPAQFIVIGSTLFYTLSAIYAYHYINRKSHVNLVTMDVIKHIAKVFLHSVLVLFLIYFFARYYLEGLPHVVVLAVAGVVFVVTMIFSGKILKIDYMESVKLLIKK